jgi:hypothetical protein
MRHLILTGDSHLGCIKRGSELNPDSIHPGRLTFWPLGGGGGARACFHSLDEVAKRVSTNSPRWKNRIFDPSTIREVGNEPIIVVSLPMNTSRILRDYSWVKHVPWQLSTIEFSLSDQVVETLILQDSQFAVDFVLDLKKIWPDVVVVEGPRPFANARFFRTVKPDVIKHIDCQYRRQVSKRLLAAGVFIVTQPSASITSDGTTDLEFDSEDPSDDHHANERYGRMVLEDILAFSERLGK